MFDLENYKGHITTDLFGEDSYFDDAEAFWALQNAEIAKAKDTYLAKGWADVVELEDRGYFPRYDYTEAPKKEGGKVFVHVAANGEVAFYEGLLSRVEIEALHKAENGEAAKPLKPELTKAMQNYLALHCHAAVRLELLSHPQIALRLAVAQIIAGSDLWTVQADPQKANTEKIRENLEASTAQAAFIKSRQKMCDMLGLKQRDDQTIVPRRWDRDQRRDLHKLFFKLLSVSDKEALQILTFVVAECLPSGSATVEILGHLTSVDMQKHWQPDQTFLDLIRDKDAINAMVAEIAGKEAADARSTATAKSQKAVIQACLEGTRTAKVKNWHPRYMVFPMGAYTKKGGIVAVDQWKAIKRHMPKS